ncbi:MAG: T9SS type A sorting domain-containing protein [Fibrobacterota bacterium]
MKKILFALMRRGSYLSVVMLFVLSQAAFSGERLLCGFEEAELSPWPLSATDAGDGDIKYKGGGDRADVGWLTSQGVGNATQGTRALCHEIFAANPTASKMVRFQSRWQDWSWLTSTGYDGGAGGWDSTNTHYEEYTGNVEWNVNRFCSMFSLFRTIDMLPDSLQDWSGFDYLYFDVKSTAAKIWLWVQVRGKDRPSHRCVYGIEPGQFVTVRVPIREMGWVGNLDMTDIKNLRIMLRKAEGVTQVFIDNVRLATADVAPALPVVDDPAPVAPWLLTSWHNTPQTPHPNVDIPAKITGPVIASAPVTLAHVNSGYDNSRVAVNLANGVSAFDNNHCAVVAELSGYAPWLSGSLTTNRSWIATRDGGALWGSVEEAGGQPSVFTTHHRGSYNTWTQGDLQLRGAQYLLPMGWCGSNGPGSGFMMYHYFYKVTPTQAGWQPYPRNTFTTLNQKWPVIVAMDESRGCMGGARITSLPSGRLWMAGLSNNLNAYRGWSLFTSFSDDGGRRWRFPSGRPAVYVPSDSQPYSFGVNNSMQSMFPYKHNKVLILKESGGNLYYSLGDGQSWTAFSLFMNNDYKRDLINGVTYKDSTLYMCFHLTTYYSQGPGYSLVKWQNGTFTEQVVALSPNMSRGLLSLCGERIWFTWIDVQENALYCKKYFINSNTWSASLKLYQGTGTIRALEVATVTPPAYVPIVWYEINTADTTKTDIRFLKVPMDADERAADSDFDGLDDATEAAYGATVGNPDSDGDGLWDGQEVTVTGTRPDRTDTDGDGDNDAVELYGYTDPRDPNRSVTGNQAPVTALSRMDENGRVRLSAEQTVDPDGDVLRYFWEIVTKGQDTFRLEGMRVVVPESLSSIMLTVDDGQGHIVTHRADVNMEKINGASGLSALQLKAQPSPFNTALNIRYTIPQNIRVRMALYDIRGKKIADIENGTKKQGTHQRQWRPATSLTAGFYLLKLSAGAQTRTQTLVYMK